MINLSLDLYRKLYLIRRVEQYIIKHYPENEMKCPMHMSMGQEAISVGVCHALHPEDQVFGTYRSHAAFLAKTGNLDKFFGEIYGRVTGTAHGKSGSMHVASPEEGYMGSSGVVGNCIPVAVGAAFANKYKKNGNITCVFFGDGALDTGVFWESLNLACLKKLPILFVVEDNGYSVNTPTSMRQSFEDITDIVVKFGCSVGKEFAFNVETIHKIASVAIEAIKTMNRPSLLYIRCYRYLEHVGIKEDFDIGYRPRREFEWWYKRDSVNLQRGRLLDLGYRDIDIQEEERLIDKQIEDSAKRTREAPKPEPAELYKSVFAE